jgi:RND family efflux transporter MFP subunit
MSKASKSERGATFLTQATVATLLVSLGVAGFIILMKTRSRAAREPRPERATLVEVQPIEAKSHRLTVRAQGTVVPARQVELRPEISGRIVWQSDQLAAGGRFRAGEAILRIDGRDYRLALEQQRATVDRAQLDLEVERGRKVVAEREWDLLPDGNSSDESGRALALREPQLRTARVGLESARSALKRAEINLERTTVRAPFGCFVTEESADLGQLVTPATRLGTLVGTDRFWVQVSVPVDRLTWIDIPSGGELGSTARVWQQAGEVRIERTGHVLRLLGELDPVGRMARLVIAIEDPLETKPDAGTGRPLPLLLGAYVNVEIQGETIDGAIELPRLALREGDRVFVMNDASRLEIRQVDVIWRRADTVLVKSGVQSGERIVKSRVAAPIPGMRLRLGGDSGTAARRADAAPARPAKADGASDVAHQQGDRDSAAAPAVERPAALADPTAGTQAP